MVPTYYYNVQVVDSALSSIFNQIDAATASAPPPPQQVTKDEEETVPKNGHDVATVAPQTLVQQPAEERRHHRPLRRQASLSKSAGAAVKTTGLKQNGIVALGQRVVSDASAAAVGTIQPLADDTAGKIEKSAAVPVLNKKTQERRQHEREGTTTGHKFIVKSLASEDSKYITVSTDVAPDETKDPKDLQHGEVAKNAKTEKTSSKDGNGYFGSWSGGLFNNKEQQRSNGDTTFHVYSAVEAETDKIKVGMDIAIEEGRAASKSPH